MNKKNLKRFHISDIVHDFVMAQQEQMKDVQTALLPVREANQLKVIHSFQENRLASHDFHSSSGYGYGEGGREKADRIFADVFQTEDALVRPSIASGTHALTLALQGLLLPGDEMLCISGLPYDTMQKIIGLRGSLPHSLKEYGITYRQTELKDGAPDVDAIKNAITKNTRLIYLQRSGGYAGRPAIPIGVQKQVYEAIRSFTDLPIMVDNCYGEFTEEEEPTEVGANLIAGSLIKNPGGGIARAGGYIAGDADLIERISYRLTTPGIGRDIGISFDTIREVLQGLYFAPHVTMEALHTAQLFAGVYQTLGYAVTPGPNDERSDIVQVIRMEDPEAVCRFCEAVQAAGSVDAYVTPVPWDMPGYSEQVIMASSGFVEGSSIEVSADGPLKPPYHVFYQGGLSYDQGRLAVMKTVQALLEHGIIREEQLLNEI